MKLKQMPRYTSMALIKQLALGREVRAPIIRVVIVSTVVTPLKEKKCLIHWMKIYFTYITSFHLFNTYANASRDRRLTDPEGHPGQNHKSTRWHICLQNEVKDASLQLEVKNQLWVPA